MARGAAAIAPAGAAAAHTVRPRAVARGVIREGAFDVAQALGQVELTARKHRAPQRGRTASRARRGVGHSRRPAARPARSAPAEPPAYEAMWGAPRL